MFDMGDIEALGPNRQTGENPATRRRLAGGGHPKPNPTNQADLATEAVKAGNLGKAITLVDSNGVAPATQEFLISVRPS